MSDPASDQRKFIERVEPELYTIGKKLDVGAKTRNTGGKSKALSDDPFGSIGDRIVQPPYDPAVLAEFLETSPDLYAAVHAMAANIDGFGHTLDPLVNLTDTTPEPDIVKAAMQAEADAIENWLDVAGDDSDMLDLRRRRRVDLESTGYAFWEVIRDGAGQVAYLKHLPSREMRLGRIDDTAVEVKVPQLMRDGQGGWKLGSRVVWRKMRCYVQAKTLDRSSRTLHSGLYGNGRAGAQTMTGQRWFKAFGDPRVIDAETGEEAKPGESVKLPANEAIYSYIYSARTPYGVPRWISALINVMGNRAAEEINYTTFTNNNIPSMAVTVSGGRLTAGSIQRIKTFTETHIQQSRNYSTFMILEGESGLEGDEAGTVKVDIKPLAAQQRDDAMFVTYRAQGSAEIFKPFRLPSMFAGTMKDINRAAAETIRRLTDEQVFGPERDAFDKQINATIWPHLGWKYWKYKSRTPNVTDDRDLIAMMAAAERTGGMTPRIAREIFGGIHPAAARAPALDPAIADKPFSLTVAKEVKNMAGGSEINNQVAPVMPGGDPRTAPVTKDLDSDLAAANWAAAELALAVPEMAEIMRAMHGDP